MLQEHGFCDLAHATTSLRQGWIFDRSNSAYQNNEENDISREAKPTGFYLFAQKGKNLCFE
jgi:hypothetical protein